MSDLTIALAAVGGVLLAVVVAHGAWQARKAGPKRAAGEPLPRGEAREPVLEAAGADSARPPAPVEAFEPRAPKRAVARLDALIDAIAPLTVESPVSGDVVLTHLPPARRAGTKPFLIEGLDAETGEWEAPVQGRRYGELQAGVQLANRTGPLNEIEYSEFVQKVQSFAEAIGAMADFPDMLDVVARARELDGFAGEHDAQLAVRLQARSAAWSVGYILQHAGRHGFVAGAVPGRLVLPSTEEGAPPVLTLTFDSQAVFADDPSRAAVRDVTLSFDVPQTDPRAEPFVAWQASAQALSLGMDAAIVDDNGRPLSPEGFAAIGSELEQLYAALETRDLTAGSAAARRLFS
ncbi:cell division protein FtsZ [Piscinibacter sp.]|uniref:cell division protein FtsZ n=1 Tax=Piscinibacter sp. TaxID=1903157 RepID=UPI002CE89182|nr:cell division protein FtsZ [Albitalea sp.]HUG23387.1 cell division protein FtsZ [Albitalea sp.]